VESNHCISETDDDLANHCITALPTLHCVSSKIRTYSAKATVLQTATTLQLRRTHIADEERFECRRFGQNADIHRRHFQPMA
jgi:hypothetical protein